MLKRAGRYEILAELGRGGFGQVYRAVDPTLDSMVAIKTLAVDNDASILARFRNEAAASRRLRHPNIVTIYDFGEQDGIPFIVMELLEGQDLQRVIESRRPLPMWHKIQIMTQIASGLAHAHAHGIVHRDVKPANIMLLPDGSIKIMDFGIALISQDTQNRLTPRGAVIGTFRYMAPEQFRGSQQDARGDIFAYGLMFYELLSGIHPFHATEPAAAMYNTMNLEPVPITEVCPQCPEQLWTVISRLLQKDPEFRYQNLEDVLFDCEPILIELKHAQAHTLFQEVTLARENSRIETAQTLLRQVMELDPSYPGARELREQLQTELRRSAVRPRVEALTSEARDHLAAGNPSEALVKFEAAVRLDPSDITLKSWLEQAKAALEQSRQVARLVADAERALQSGDLTGAHRIARQAIELAPTDKRAREIGARAEAALAEQERQARLATDLARARRLIEIGSWDESSSVLDYLEHEFPRLAEIRVLREMLRAGRWAEERQQRLSAGLAAARQDIQARSLDAASHRLTELHAEFPTAADVEQLLRYVTSEIEAQRQRDVVDRGLRESRAFAEQNRFEAAAEVLQAALASYPADPVLQRELRSVATARQQAEREAALNQALGSAKALQAQGSFEEAVAPLDSFFAKYGPEPAVEELRRTIKHDREAARRAVELREMVLRINHLLSQGNAEEATMLLQAPPTPIKDHPEITHLRMLAQAQLDRQIERRAALDQALADADTHRQKGDFGHALQTLAAFTARFGADPKVVELEKSIRRDWEESQRRAEEVRGLVNRATEFLAEGKAVEATQLFRSCAAYVKEDPEVTKILDQAGLQINKQAEREAALQNAISSAAVFQQQGRFDEALALLDAFSRQNGADGRVAELEQTIQSGRAAARRAAEIRDLEARGRSLFEQNDLEAAIALLKQAPVLVNESQELRELLSGAESALAAKQRQELVEAAIAEARSRMSRGELDAALDAIDRSLQRFPSEAKLKTARAGVLAAQAAKQREEYRGQVIAEVNSLIAKHDYSRAFKVHEEALGKLSGDPQLQRLRAEVEAHKRDWETLQIEQKIQDTVRRARELRPGQPAESVALLEKLCAQHPDRPELTAQLAESREELRKAAERDLILQAEKLCQKNKFSEAIAKLKQADRETPELKVARQQVESRRAAAVSQRIAKGIQSAREAGGLKPSQGLRELEKLRQEFPGRPEIESAIEDYRQVILAREREQAQEEARRAAAKVSTAAHASSVAEVRQPVAPQAQRAALISHPRIALVAASILVAVLAAAAWWVARPRGVVRTSIVPVPVEVRTDPEGASVRVGDRTCVTPKCQLDVPPGRYNVQAQLKGYEPIQQALEVTVAHPGSLDLTLRPLPAPPPPASIAGNLIVRTGVADVLVIVDDLPRGRTDADGSVSVPLEAKKTHSVRVEKPGYETSREQRVRIGERATETAVFKVTMQMATLQLRGAPAGVELRADGRLIGRTGASPFSATVPPGDQVLRLTEGSASRELSERFEPGKILTLDWASVAPSRVVTPPAAAPAPPSPPKPNQPDPSEQAWTSASSASDPAAVRNFLDNYPNSRHAPEAQALLESLTWSRVNQNDMQSLRDYLNRFRGGPHARDASRRLAELVWNAVNQKDEQAVRSFIEQNPDSSYKSQAQGILEQFEKQRLDAEDRLRQERAKQEQAKQPEQPTNQIDAQRGQVLAALDRFNTAFAQHKQRELKAVWPAMPQSYIEALKTTSLLSFEGSQVVSIAGDVSTVNSNLATVTSPPRPPQPVTVTLQKRAGDWVIVKLEKR